MERLYDPVYLHSVHDFEFEEPLNWNTAYPICRRHYNTGGHVGYVTSSNWPFNFVRSCTRFARPNFQHVTWAEDRRPRKKLLHAKDAVHLLVGLAVLLPILMGLLWVIDLLSGFIQSQYHGYKSH